MFVNFNLNTTNELTTHESLGKITWAHKLRISNLGWNLRYSYLSWKGNFSSISGIVYKMNNLNVFRDLYFLDESEPEMARNNMSKTR